MDPIHYGRIDEISAPHRIVQIADRFDVLPAKRLPEVLIGSRTIDYKPMFNRQSVQAKFYRLVMAVVAVRPLYLGSLTFNSSIASELLK